MIKYSGRHPVARQVVRTLISTKKYAFPVRLAKVTAPKAFFFTILDGAREGNKQENEFSRYREKRRPFSAMAEGHQVNAD